MDATEEIRKHWASLLASGGISPQTFLGAWFDLAAQVMGTSIAEPRPAEAADTSADPVSVKTGASLLSLMPDWTAAFAPFLSASGSPLDNAQGNFWPWFSAPTENPLTRMLGHPAFTTGGENSTGRLSVLASTALYDFLRTATAHQALQVQGWMKALQRFFAEFAEDAAGGRPVLVESLDDLLGHWSVVGETALQEHQRSEPFLQSQAEMLRTAMRWRIAQRKIVEAAARANDLPTQSDLDEAFASIHALQNEVRQLRRQVRPAPLVLAADSKAAAPAKATAPADRSTSAARAKAARPSAPGRHRVRAA